MERDYKTKIEKLEADLKESRKGFENERQILLKQHKETTDDFEKQLKEMKEKYEAEI